jgi:hypothetical protein
MGPVIRRAGRRLSEEGRRRRLAIGVPPKLVEEPAWRLAPIMGMKVDAFNIRLAQVDLAEAPAKTGTG